MFDFTLSSQTFLGLPHCLTTSISTFPLVFFTHSSYMTTFDCASCTISVDIAIFKISLISTNIMQRKARMVNQTTINKIRK